jgi:hypothetical protein
MPSDNFIKPQIADQVAIGYFRNFKMIATHWSRNLLQGSKIDWIISMVLIIANKAIEQIILNGQLRSYG